MAIRGLLVAVALAGSIVAAGPATAAVDVTGSWVVTTNTVIGPIASRWDFQQTGAQVSLAITFLDTLPGSMGPFPGTIDSDTGAFDVDLGPPTPPFPGVPPCPSSHILGTASADGTAISGFFGQVVYRPSPFMGCADVGGSFAGSRCAAGVPGCPQPGCGNGFVDAGEECDDGLLESPCCSDSCEFEPGGTACTSDSNVCTDDVCDGTGACQHVDNAASCDSECRPGATCAGGVCTGQAAPAGTSCSDGNACTQPDQCNGSGSCLAGAAVTCGACELCQSGTGCVAQPRIGCRSAVQSRLVLSARSAAKRSAKWTHQHDTGGFPVGVFDDPTTTAEYDLCAFDAAGLLFRTTAPPGGTCAGKPCWQAKPRGSFRYRDREGTPEGAVKVELAAQNHGTKVQVAGKGPNLNLPAALDTLIPPLTIQLQARGPGATACWVDQYDAAVIDATPTKLKAGRR